MDSKRKLELGTFISEIAKARAQCARNLERGACPDCGAGLVENKLADEAMQYCPSCDFTYTPADFAEIRAYLAQHKAERVAA
jgi:hypothetical protein